jgi:hypothetical protein
VVSNKTSDGSLRFRHFFSRSVSCEMTAPDHPPEPGSLNVVSIVWTGRPKPKHIPAYRAWCLSTQQTLADRWGLTMAYALGVAPDRTELWSFTPGGTPKLVDVLKGGL